MRPSVACCLILVFRETSSSEKVSQTQRSTSLAGIRAYLSVPCPWHSCNDALGLCALSLTEAHKKPTPEMPEAFHGQPQKDSVKKWGFLMETATPERIRNGEVRLQPRPRIFQRGIRMQRLQQRHSDNSRSVIQFTHDVCKLQLSIPLNDGSCLNVTGIHSTKLHEEAKILCGNAMKRENSGHTCTADCNDWEEC